MAQALTSLQREFLGRPAFLLFLGLACGLAWRPTLGLSLAGVLLLLWFGKKGWPFALALLWGAFFSPVAPPLVLERSGFSGQVEVQSIPALQRNGVSAVVSNGGSRWRAFFPEGSSVAKGDVLVLSGELRSLAEGSTASEGVSGNLRVTAVEQVVRQGFPLWRWATGIRQSFVNLVQKADPGDQQLLGAALCFNVTSGIEPEFYDALRATGTVHMISTSGLHVMVAAAFLVIILSRLPVSQEVRLVIFACVLILYAAAAGLRPPIVRAVIMSLVFASAFLFRRQPDGLSSLSLAAVIYMVFVPSTIVDLGFWLSVMAVGSLVLFAPTRDEWVEATGRDRLWFAVRASLVVSLATAPLVAWAFGEISVIGFVMNLLVVPVVDLAIVVALGAWMVGAVSPGLSEGLYGGLATPLLRLIEGMVRVGAEAPFATLSVPGFSGWWILLFVVGGFLLWRRSGTRA